MNVVLVDFNTSENWDFLDILNKNKEGWTVESCSTNKLMNSKGKVLLRYILFFLFPLLIVIKRRKYEKIVTWQQFYGLNYAFWCRLFHLPKVNDLTVMTFIYARKQGRIGRIYHRYMSYIVKSKYMTGLLYSPQKKPHIIPNVSMNQLNGSSASHWVWILKENRTQTIPGIKKWCSPAVGPGVIMISL